MVNAGPINMAAPDCSRQSCGRCQKATKLYQYRA